MISIKNLTKTHINSKKSKVLALDDINIELPSTGLVYLKGESGSGKTTLLNILGGLDVFDNGSMTINGKEFKGLKQNEIDSWRSFDTAFIFQDYNLISNYNVSENIKMGKRFQGKDCTDEEVFAILKMLKLEGYESRMPNDLSGGEKQRVAIARALIRSPKLLIVDEPTAQLDNENATIILKTIKKISKTLLTICVSHDEETMLKYADRIVELKKGKLIKDEIINVKPKPKLIKKDENIILQDDKKSSVKIKHLIKLGAKNLHNRKTKTAMLVLLTCFSLLFFSVFYMLTGYNKYTTLAFSAKQDEVKYIGFSDVNINNSIYNDIYEAANTNLYRFSTVDWDSGIKGLIEIDLPLDETGKYNNLSQEILIGTYPDYNSVQSKKSIVITDYYANQLIENGVATSIQGLLNKEITAHTAKSLKKINANDVELQNIEIKLTICAVVKTDYQKYNNINLLPGTKEYVSWQHNLQNVYMVCHVAPGFIDEYAKTFGIESVSNVITEASFNGDDAINNYYSNTTIANFNTLSSAELANLYNVAFSAVPYSTTGLTDLAVIVSKDIYENFARVNSNDFYINLSINGSEVRQYTMVAFINTPVDKPIIIFSDEQFNVMNDSVSKNALMPTTQLILEVNNANIQELANLTKLLENDFGLTFNSSTADSIYNFSEKIEIFKTAFLIFGTFSIAYSVVLLYNFIVALINDKRKDIGILRSLGANSSNIFKIFITTISIISLTCFAITSALATIISVIINAVAKSSGQLSFHVVNVSFGLYGYLFVICALVAAVATIIPITFYSDHTPIKQIKSAK